MEMFMKTYKEKKICERNDISSGHFAEDTKQLDSRIITKQHYDSPQ
jgi:hypothetical protein